MALIAGSHNAFFSASSVGSGSGTFIYLGNSTKGFDKTTTNRNQDVMDDSSGEVPLDAIQLGSITTVRFSSIEYDRLASCALFSQNAYGVALGNVGKSVVSLSGTLILVPIANTPAALQITAGKCRIFYLAVVDSGYDILMAASLRQGPITFKCFPDPNAGYLVEAVVPTANYTYSDGSGTPPAAAGNPPRISNSISFTMY